MLQAPLQPLYDDARDWAEIRRRCDSASGAQSAVQARAPTTTTAASTAAAREQTRGKRGLRPSSRPLLMLAGCEKDLRSFRVLDETTTAPSRATSLSSRPASRSNLVEDYDERSSINLNPACCCKAPSARDRTTYGRARYSTRQFYLHHTRLIAKAAVIHDAMGIRVRRSRACVSESAPRMRLRAAGPRGAAAA